MEASLKQGAIDLSQKDINKLRQYMGGFDHDHRDLQNRIQHDAFSDEERNTILPIMQRVSNYAKSCKIQLEEGYIELIKPIDQYYYIYGHRPHIYTILDRREKDFEAADKKALLDMPIAELNGHQLLELIRHIRKDLNL